VPWIYDYGLLDEFAVNAYLIEHYQECLDACQRLLSEGKIPADMKDRVKKNADFAREKINLQNISLPSIGRHALAREEHSGSNAMYRPMIYTSCYGDQCYFDCLSLMLKSLYVFGRYRGGILVLADRTETQITVPDEMRDGVRSLCRDAIDMSTRFQIQEFIGACDSPVLHIDSDIIVTQEIDPILHKMSKKGGIYVCSELALKPQFANVPVSAITDQYANWYGLELFLNDAELRDRPLPCLNAGLFGFSERRIFEEPARQIHDMYTSDRWPSIASRYADQPFFNYVMAKSEPFDAGLLSGALSLVTTAQNAVQFPRPFVHFLWTKGSEKAQQMSQYMDFLESSRVLDPERAARKVPLAQAPKNINRNIPGQMSDAELHRIMDIAEKVPEGGIIVEVGALYGLTTWHMSVSCKAGVTIFAIDPWAREQWITNLVERPQAAPPFSFESFQAYTKDCYNIVPIRGHSPDIARGWGIKIDCYVEDSVHTNPTLSRNIAFWRSFIKPGGIICGHDYEPQWPDVMTEVDNLARHEGKEIKIVDSLWSIDL